MKSLLNYVDQIKLLTHELIEVAVKLRDLSLNVVSEEDLLSLQKRQGEILKELESADQEIQQHYRQQLDDATKEHLDKQMIKFQELNQEFIKNLNSSHGLIQFELHRIDDESERDFSHHFRGLNKMTLTPPDARVKKSHEEESP